MNNMILTTDFSQWQIENYNTEILIEAKNECARKMKFHQSEINAGYVSEYHFEQMATYKAEFLKWVPIVLAAKERDAKRQSEFEAYFN